MNIWITGASGMLARDFKPLAEAAGHNCLGTDLDVDITDRAAVQAWLRKHPIDWVVNCAAYTAVDKAETDEDKAFAINALGPAILAEESAQAGACLLHISTDYVLNGCAPTPLQEQCALDPQNAYGRTKAKGELRVQSLNPNHWIVRTAWLYGIYGNNFVKTMLRLMGEKDFLKVIDDQWGSPTWTVDLSHAMLAIISSGENPGIYHFTNEGKTTWCAFAQEIQKQAITLGLLQRQVPVYPTPTSDYPTPASRPHWSVLDKAKIRSNFSLHIPSWQESLTQYMQLELGARA